MQGDEEAVRDSQRRLRFQKEMRAVQAAWATGRL